MHEMIEQGIQACEEIHDILNRYRAELHSFYKKYPATQEHFGIELLNTFSFLAQKKNMSESEIKIANEVAIACYDAILRPKMLRLANLNRDLSLLENAIRHKGK